MDLDQIDKLGGSLSHQGGPYDALAPSRNRNRDRANSDAPVAAFDPQGVNSNPAVFDPQVEKEYRMEPHLELRDELTDDAPIRGPSSAGLGSTTYLDNAPASQQAIREQEQNTSEQQEESLLGRIRSFSRRDQEESEGEGLLSRVKSITRGNRSRSNTATSNRSTGTRYLDPNDSSAGVDKFDFTEPKATSTTHETADTLHQRRQ